MKYSKLTNDQKEKMIQILLDSIKDLTDELNNQEDAYQEPDYVTESDIDFYAPELGSQTSGYHFKCYDAFAVADNGIVQIKVTYPFLYQILNDKSKSDECLSYRYGGDHSKYAYELHFGDVMMKYGKLESFKLL